MNRILKYMIACALIFTVISCKKEEKTNPCEQVIQDEFELVP